MWCAIGGFTSAKILFWITNWREFLQNPRQIIGSDGFVVYGGIIGGILVGWLYCRIKKLKFLEYFDLMMPSIALAQGFGRIGCFLAGCCYGERNFRASGDYVYKFRFCTQQCCSDPDTDLFRFWILPIFCCCFMWQSIRKQMDRWLPAILFSTV